MLILLLCHLAELAAHLASRMRRCAVCDSAVPLVSRLCVDFDAMMCLVPVFRGFHRVSRPPSPTHLKVPGSAATLPGGGVWGGPGLGFAPGVQGPYHPCCSLGPRPGGSRPGFQPTNLVLLRIEICWAAPRDLDGARRGKIIHYKNTKKLQSCNVTFK